MDKVIYCIICLTFTRCFLDHSLIRKSLQYDQWNRKNNNSMTLPEKASWSLLERSEHSEGIPGRTKCWSQCLFASTYPKGKAVALLVCLWRCWLCFIPGHLWKNSCWRGSWGIWRCIPQGKEMKAMMSVWWQVSIQSWFNSWMCFSTCEMYTGLDCHKPQWFILIPMLPGQFLLLYRKQSADSSKILEQCQSN